MREHVERRTSWKVVIAYLFVIAFCGAMFYYIYNLQGSIQNQKVNINIQNQSLALTNRFTQLVHEAQSEANLFAFSDNPKHLKLFGSLTNEISLCADSILEILPSKKNEQKIREVERLIMRKGQISYVLSRHFYYYDPLAEIDAWLQAYTPPAPPVFQQNEGDSLSLVEPSTQRNSLSNDTVDIVHALKLLSNKARLEYKKRVKEYEKKTAELITDDNHLSEEIADLLLALNKEILDTSIVEIEKSETLIKENSKNSTLIAAIVLLLTIVFIILILIDVNKSFRTRREAVEARLMAEEAQRKAEELMENRHKMLLTVSHDIKTPLSSIVGNLDLMENDGNEKELTSIRHSADHILNLLSNLLEFSSLEQGKLHVENAPFNICALCTETADMFKPIAQKKALAFDFNNQIPSNLQANSDRLKIKQIISNMISNAIKYTIEGGVGFSAGIEDDNLVFRVKDSGIGIPEDQLEDIFKPFVRTDTGSKLSEGSGYGLSVVKGLVDLLEGSIDVQSEVGKGSCFTVKIPAAIQLEEAGTPVLQEAAPEHPANVGLSDMQRILIIDDDDTLLTVLSNMIDKLGHQVLISRSKSDLDAALEQTDSFDCVLTDREMGALSGNDILKLFKSAAPEKPVYLMTARMDYNTEKAREEGFDGFLQKPFSLKMLEQMFGRYSKEATAPKASSFTDFPALCEMMNDDEQAIRGVLTVFAQSTADHLVALNEAVERDDFAAAHALCHKMLPMFIQLQQDDAVPFLSRMNESKGKKEGADAYPAWKEDAVKFMSSADNLLELLAEKYEVE